jgi:hypothetical protein
MFSMWESHAGSFCESPRFGISSELLQMHGRSFFQSCFLLSSFDIKDCGEVVASKFFPIDGPNGKQNPLCERDYFRRLNLICEKCGMALRGSYITACSAFLILSNPVQFPILGAFFLQTRSITSTISLVRYVRRSLDPRTPIMNMTTMSTAISIIQHDSRRNVQDVTAQF